MHDFGPAAAQLDLDLMNYFHITAQAKRLVDFSKPNPAFIYVARPGAGKTALKKWLSLDTEKHLTLTITSENTRLYSDDKFINSGDLKLMIGVGFITAIISEIAMWPHCQSSSKILANKFLSESWNDVVKKFFKENFSGLAILGVGFSLKPAERKGYLQEIRQNNRLIVARETLAALTSKTKVILVIDDPELLVNEGLDDLTPENGKRVGALLSELAHVYARGVRVIVFVRENIFQNTREHYLDFAHFLGRVEGLEWTSGDLVKLLRRRVKNRIGKTWGQVFAIRPNELEEHLFRYLINGPRDLVTLSNTAGGLGGKISLDRYDRALRAYPSQKWEELSSYYGGQWPGIDQFAKALVDALRKKYKRNAIPPGGITKVFEKEFTNTTSEIHRLRGIIPWVDKAKWESPSVDERLFIVGCLGYSYEDSTYFPWSGRNLDTFRIADSWFIAPVFNLD